MCSDHQSGQFRLMDGNEGRLEVCVGGQWRGVCTASLSNTTAGEICTRLGFSGDGIIMFMVINYDCFTCNTIRTHCDEL